MDRYVQCLTYRLDGLPKLMCYGTLNEGIEVVYPFLARMRQDFPRDWKIKGYELRPDKEHPTIANVVKSKAEGVV